MNVLAAHMHPEVATRVVLIAEVAHFGPVARVLDDGGEPVEVGGRMVSARTRVEIDAGGRRWVAILHLDEHCLAHQRLEVLMQRHVLERVHGRRFGLLRLQVLVPREIAYGFGRLRATAAEAAARSTMRLARSGRHDSVACRGGGRLVCRLD